MLVSVFCSRRKFVKCVECRCSKGFVALSGAETGEGNARDAEGVSRVSGCICDCPDSSRCLM